VPHPVSRCRYEPQCFQSRLPSTRRRPPKELLKQRIDAGSRKCAPASSATATWQTFPSTSLHCGTDSARTSAARQLLSSRPLLRLPENPPHAAAAPRRPNTPAAHLASCSASQSRIAPTSAAIQSASRAAGFPTTPERAPQAAPRGHQQLQDAFQTRSRRLGRLVRNASLHMRPLGFGSIGPRSCGRRCGRSPSAPTASGWPRGSRRPCALRTSSGP
jgi:hypothetical protein